MGFGPAKSAMQTLDQEVGLRQISPVPPNNDPPEVVQTVLAVLFVDDGSHRIRLVFTLTVELSDHAIGKQEVHPAQECP